MMQPSLWLLFIALGSNTAQEIFSYHSAPGSLFEPHFSYHSNYVIHPPRSVFTPEESDNRGSIFGSQPIYFRDPKKDQKNQCTQRPQCNNTAKYRTYDGTCNNLENPLWGAANTPYGRVVPNRYADGVHAYPKSVTRRPLPQPRILSRIFLPPADKDDPKWSLLFMQFGQIMVHDMAEAYDSMPDPANPTCCNHERGPLFHKTSKGERCQPVLIQRDDPIYQKHKQTCFDFRRTTTDAYRGCRSGKAAKPLSSVTHWLDASLVYGSDEKTARDLRVFQSGLLRVEERGGASWPPTQFNASVGGCLASPPKQVCYKAGDNRVNQNPGLAMLQIIYLREHNRIARKLAEINPHWDDEILFQEARRILTAEHQYISYYEWLPILFDLEIKLPPSRMDGSYENDYDPKVDPSVLNEHSHAAFRFLHSAIQGKLQMFDEERTSKGFISLAEHMTDVSILEKSLDDIVRGHTTQPEHAFDRYHSLEVVEDIFRNPKTSKFGFDLKAIDIQRDRDHGLGSYNDLREWCKRPRARTFDDFVDVMAPEDTHRLAQVYAHPDDVDLTIGGYLEGRGPAGPVGVGPTFTCIMKEQFRRTRVSDRFFFEFGDHPGAFTPAQLIEIRKSSMARFLCDHTGVKSMQPEAFQIIEEDNKLVPCDDHEKIPIVDLEAWKEAKNSRLADSQVYISKK